MPLIDFRNWQGDAIIQQVNDKYERTNIKIIDKKLMIKRVPLIKQNKAARKT